MDAVAAGAAAGAASALLVAAAAEPPAAFWWDGEDLEDIPELRGPVRGCSVGGRHVAVGTGRCRGLRLFGDNSDGQLGTGDTDEREGLVATNPILRDVISFGCGCHTVALRRGGALSSWGDADAGALGRGGPPHRPAAVPGVPPVAALYVGFNSTMVLTYDDQVWGWGGNEHGTLALGRCSEEEAPQRIADLSGRGVLRIAMHMVYAVAETATRQLIWWGRDAERRCNAPQLLQGDAQIAFPLRSLAASHSAVDPGRNHAVAVDAAGWLVFCRVGASRLLHPPPARVLLHGQRAVRVAVACLCGFPDRVSGTDLCPALTLALTEGGELWDVSDPLSCRNISSELPMRGLVPHGGTAAFSVLLERDTCAGKDRLELFARVAMRLGVPSDLVRDVLTPLLVHEAYITGPVSDPFGRPVTSTRL